MASDLDDALRLAVAPGLPEGGREFQFMPMQVSSMAKLATNVSRQRASQFG
jgi:hypothetical protein